MKWLVVQPGFSFSVHDVYNGWCEALRDLGEQVSRYALDERILFYSSVHVEAGAGQFRQALDPNQAVGRAVDGLYSHLYRWQPDVLLLVYGAFIPLDLLDLARSRGTRVVVLHTESPYEDDRQVRLAEHADLNLINDPTNIARFPAGTAYVPHAYRPDLHRPGPAKPGYAADFAFVGTGYPSRIAFLEQMALDGVDVLLAGNWQNLADDHSLRKNVAHDIDDCLDNDQAADVYRSSRVGINLYRRESQRPELEQGWAVGPREVEMAACGMPFLRDPRGEGDELLPMLPTFTTPAEATERLRWWLAHDDARQDAARLARAAVADRTFTNNAAALLRALS